MSLPSHVIQDGFTFEISEVRYGWCVRCGVEVFHRRIRDTNEYQSNTLHKVEYCCRNGHRAVEVAVVIPVTSIPPPPVQQRQQSKMYKHGYASNVPASAPSAMDEYNAYVHTLKNTLDVVEKFQKVFGDNEPVSQQQARQLTQHSDSQIYQEETGWISKLVHGIWFVVTLPFRFVILAVYYLFVGIILVIQGLFGGVINVIRWIGITAYNLLAFILRAIGSILRFIVRSIAALVLAVIILIVVLGGLYFLLMVASP